ncbi:DUF1538 domain-containing protein [Desulfovibrionales bacterium]
MVAEKKYMTTAQAKGDGALLHKLKEAFVSLAPVVLLALVMHVLTGFMTSELLIRWFVGAFFVFIGSFFFLRGVDYCLSPLGDMFGSRLVFSPNLVILLGIALLVSLAANAADPSVAVLAAQIKTVSTATSPPPWLVIVAVVSGIGIFFCLALLRIIFSLPSALVLGAGYGGTLLLGMLVPQAFVALAFDSGGVATGPLTVPFLLSLGIGFVSVLGRRSSSADSFGILGFVALGPMVGVMLLGIVWT